MVPDHFLMCFNILRAQAVSQHGTNQSGACRTTIKVNMRESQRHIQQVIVTNCKYTNNKCVNINLQIEAV